MIAGDYAAAVELARAADTMRVLQLAERATGATMITDTDASRIEQAHMRFGAAAGSRRAHRYGNAR